MPKTDALRNSLHAGAAGSFDEPDMGLADSMDGSGEVKMTQQEELDRLREDLARIKEDLQMVSENYMERARDGARTMKDNAQARVQHSLDSIEQYIEERPLTSVLIAFGAGMLIGKFREK